MPSTERSIAAPTPKQSSTPSAEDFRFHLLRHIPLELTEAGHVLVDEVRRYLRDHLGRLQDWPKADPEELARLLTELVTAFETLRFFERWRFSSQSPSEPMPSPTLVML